MRKLIFVSPFSARSGAKMYVAIFSLGVLINFFKVGVRSPLSHFFNPREVCGRKFGHVHLATSASLWVGSVLSAAARSTFVSFIASQTRQFVKRTFLLTKETGSLFWNQHGILHLTSSERLKGEATDDLPEMRQWIKLLATELVSNQGKGNILH